jgi:hypothetical protein
MAAGFVAERVPCAGKTGRLIVKELLSQGKAVKAVSYSSFAFEPKEIEVRAP